MIWVSETLQEKREKRKEGNRNLRVRAEEEELSEGPEDSVRFIKLQIRKLIRTK